MGIRRVSICRGPAVYIYLDLGNWDEVLFKGDLCSPKTDHVIVRPCRRPLMK